MALVRNEDNIKYIKPMPANFLDVSNHSNRKCGFFREPCVFQCQNCYAEIYYTVAKPVDSKMVTPSHYNITANPTKLVILSELH
jgi:hypothetical protein